MRSLLSLSLRQLRSDSIDRRRRSIPEGIGPATANAAELPDSTDRCRRSVPVGATANAADSARADGGDDFRARGGEPTPRTYALSFRNRFRDTQLEWSLNAGAGWGQRARSTPAAWSRKKRQDSVPLLGMS